MTCNLAQLLRQGRDPDACANINFVSELGGVPRVEDLDNGEAGKKEANENGSLMFLVSRVKVKNERNIARLGAAGYRSTDLRQVSGHITASLRIGLQLGHQTGEDEATEMDQLHGMATMRVGNVEVERPTELPTFVSELYATLCG
ncbi:hypothetical protein VUR80DRAFT_6638 [Thermomyces stellatus]